MTTLTLGFSGIRNIIQSNWSPPFTFIFELDDCQDVKIKTNMCCATLISSLVSRHLMTDSTIDHIILNAKGINEQEIMLFFSILDEGKLEMSTKNARAFYKISELIMSDDIKNTISDIYDQISSEENILVKIQLKIEKNLDYSEELNYCANNLIELIKKHSFDDFPDEIAVNLLEEILGIYKQRFGKMDKIENQQKIFKFLFSFNDKDFIKLASYLNFKLLNETDLSEFLGRLNENSFCSQAALALTQKFDIKEKRKDAYIYNSNQKFNGILKNLEKKCGSNPILAGFLRVYPEIKEANDLFDEKKDFILPSAFSFPEIIFDFGNQNVRLYGVEIKTPSRLQPSFQPKDWQIEGSSNRDKWEILYVERNCSELKSPCKTVYFPFKTQKEYQYIKYTQKSNWGKQSEQRKFALGSIEFYGELIMK